MLGVVSIVSAVFVFVHGTFQLVQIAAAGLVVALVLGLLAVVGGWLDERALMSQRAPASRSRPQYSSFCWRAAAAVSSAATHRRFPCGWAWVLG